MALWLGRLDCKHYGGCPQWQRASGVELQCKESADSRASAGAVREFVPLPLGIECVRCESSDCVSALYDVCPLAALGRAVAMSSLSRSDLTRKHGRVAQTHRSRLEHIHREMNVSDERGSNGLTKKEENMLKVVLSLLI